VLLSRYAANYFCGCSPLRLVEFTSGPKALRTEHGTWQTRVTGSDETQGLLAIMAMGVPLGIEISSAADPREGKVERASFDLRYWIYKNELNFEHVDDARLELVTIKRWPDYCALLVAESDEHRYIMYKYFQALRRLHDSDPKYCEAISWQASGYQVVRYTNEENFRLFGALVEGFAAHVDILRKAPSSGETSAILQEALDEFKTALKNAGLTRDMFGWLLPLNQQLSENQK
jgi:hypothetical protein